MIQIKMFYADNELRNFSYLLYDNITGKAWVIDPYEASALIDYIKKNDLVLQGILNTHQHHDHVRGNKPLLEEFKTKILQLNGGQSLPINQSSELKILDTPGHTLDHQSYILIQNHIPTALFSGDMLFNAGVGNCKNGGNVDVLFETTQHLLALLPLDILIYPGHDYIQKNLEFALELGPNNKFVKELLEKVKLQAVALREPLSLREEKLINPFLRLDSQELQHRIFGENLLESSNDFKRILFKKIRALRDQW
ncbi:MAG: hydroxyacylglutathione hydrolase C-terminal domain-containing protein [Bacteriovoracaceae bacterium]